MKQYFKTTLWASMALAGSLAWSSLAHADFDDVVAGMWADDVIALWGDDAIAPDTPVQTTQEGWHTAGGAGKPGVMSIGQGGWGASQGFADDRVHELVRGGGAHASTNGNLHDMSGSGNVLGAESNGSQRHVSLGLPRFHAGNGVEEPGNAVFRPALNDLVGSADAHDDGRLWDDVDVAKSTDEPTDPVGEWACISCIGQSPNVGPVAGPQAGSPSDALQPAQVPEPAALALVAAALLGAGWAVRRHSR